MADLTTAGIDSLEGGRVSPHPLPTSTSHKELTVECSDGTIWRWLDGQWVKMEQAEVRGPTLLK